jgi:hypothetical protein
MTHAPQRREWGPTRCFQRTPAQGAYFLFFVTRVYLFSRRRVPKDALLAAANARKHLGVRAVIHTTMGDMYGVALPAAYPRVVTACLQLPQTFRRIRAEDRRKLLHAFPCGLLRRPDSS